MNYFELLGSKNMRRRFRRMKDLSFLEYDFRRRKLYIVKDHSVALKCWKAAYDEKLIDLNSTLIHIDAHSDFSYLKKNKRKSRKLLSLNETQIDEFIQNDLRPDNSEFIINAMFSGLVSGAISIINERVDDEEVTFVNRTETSVPYQTFTDSKEEHKNYIYESKSLSGLFGYKSLLTNDFKYKDIQQFYRESESVILDIDLDFFTYSIDGTYSRNPRDIIKQLETLEKLMDKSSIITIALEPSHCGSEESVIEIITVFDKVLFEPRGLSILKDIEVFIESSKE